MVLEMEPGMLGTAPLLCYIPSPGPENAFGRSNTYSQFAGLPLSVVSQATQASLLGLSLPTRPITMPCRSLLSAPKLNEQDRNLKRGLQKQWGVF